MTACAIAFGLKVSRHFALNRLVLVNSSKFARHYFIVRDIVVLPTRTTLLVPRLDTRVGLQIMLELLFEMPKPFLLEVGLTLQLLHDSTQDHLDVLAS